MVAHGVKEVSLPRRLVNASAFSPGPLRDARFGIPGLGCPPHPSMISTPYPNRAWTDRTAPFCPGGSTGAASVGPRGSHLITWAVVEPPCHLIKKKLKISSLGNLGCRLRTRVGSDKFSWWVRVERCVSLDPPFPVCSPPPRPVPCSPLRTLHNTVLWAGLRSSIYLSIRALSNFYRCPPICTVAHDQPCIL